MKPTNLIEFSNLDFLADYVDRANKSGGFHNMLMKLLNLFRRKKYYREVQCKFCHGQGQHLFNMTPEGLGRYLGSKLCKACNGKGTQTVLERVE